MDFSKINLYGNSLLVNIVVKDTIVHVPSKLLLENERLFEVVATGEGATITKPGYWVLINSPIETIFLNQKEYGILRESQIYMSFLEKPDTADAEKYAEVNGLKMSKTIDSIEKAKSKYDI